MAQLSRRQEWIARLRCIHAAMLYATLVWVRWEAGQEHPDKVLQSATKWLPIPEELFGRDQACKRSIFPSLQDDIERLKCSKVSQRVRSVGSAWHLACPQETFPEPPNVQLRLGSWRPHCDELIDGDGFAALGGFRSKLLHRREHARRGNIQDSIQAAVDHSIHRITLHDDSSRSDESQQSIEGLALIQRWRAQSWWLLWVARSHPVHSSIEVRAYNDHVPKTYDVTASYRSSWPDKTLGASESRITWHLVLHCEGDGWFRGVHGRWR